MEGWKTAKEANDAGCVSASVKGNYELMMSHHRSSFRAYSRITRSVEMIRVRSLLPALFAENYLL